MSKIEDKIEELKNRLEHYEGFVSGAKVWIQPTNGLTLRDEIDKIKNQLEILQEIKDYE